MATYHKDPEGGVLICKRHNTPMKRLRKQLLLS